MNFTSFQQDSEKQLENSRRVQIVAVVKFEMQA